MKLKILRSSSRYLIPNGYNYIDFYPKERPRAEAGMMCPVCGEMRHWFHFSPNQGIKKTEIVSRRRFKIFPEKKYQQYLCTYCGAAWEIPLEGKINWNAYIST